MRERGEGGSERERGGEKEREGGESEVGGSIVKKQNQTVTVLTNERGIFTTCVQLQNRFLGLPVLLLRLHV